MVLRSMIVGLSNVYHWFDGNERRYAKIDEKGLPNSFAKDKMKIKISKRIANKMNFHRKENQKWETLIDIVLNRSRASRINHDIMNIE